MFDLSVSDMSFWHLVAAIALGIIAARVVFELAGAAVYLAAVVWARLSRYGGN